MKEVYPTFILKDGNDYLAYVPDWDIYTEGKSYADAIEMARDAIGLKGMSYDREHMPFPESSSYDQALNKAKADADDIADFSAGILSMTDVDFLAYKKRFDNRMVKKNCTIPYYLNEAAEKEGINFSRVLQDALAERLQLKL